MRARRQLFKRGTRKFINDCYVTLSNAVAVQHTLTPWRRVTTHDNFTAVTDLFARWHSKNSSLLPPIMECEYEENTRNGEYTHF